MMRREAVSDLRDSTPRSGPDAGGTYYGRILTGISNLKRSEKDLPTSPMHVCNPAFPAFFMKHRKFPAGTGFSSPAIRQNRCYEAML